MTGLVRKALAVAAGLTVVASVAMAAVPDPRNSSVETPMVGGSSGNLLAGVGGAGYEVTVRDINNTPLANQTVVLDFSAALAVKIYSGQNAGTTVNCGSHTLSKLTNASGLAVFGPRDGAFINSASVQVSAQGVALANVPSRSTDIDGVGATTNAADLNLFRQQFFAPQPAAAPTDYTGDGNTNAADLNIFRGEFFSGVVGIYCP